MQTEKVISDRTGYCLFDGDLCFVDADPTFFEGSPITAAPEMHLAEAVAKVLPGFRHFDGKPVEATAAFGESAAARWAKGDILPVEAETIDGRWKLLTSHPRPDGGVALISTDITELKRAQIVHQENSEIFRSITDSHPLPVWVIGAENTLVLYESLPASKLLGRKWQPDTPQHLADHFANETQMADFLASLDENGISQDQALELRRADGSTLWCSANCRRGTHLGRPALIIGVLDVTERKRQHDNEVALAREMLAKLSSPCRRVLPSTTTTIAW